MTANIKFNRPCTMCWGTGIRKYNATPGGPLLEETCPECEGDGVATSDHGIEPEWFNDITDKLNDVKEKVDEIMDKLNEA